MKKLVISLTLFIIFSLLNLAPAQAQEPIVGEIRAYAGIGSIPAGWVLCDGSQLSTTTYSALYAVVGTQYGVGSSGNFVLPNCKGRNLIGYDTSNPNFSQMGLTGGEQQHTLTINEMPSHSHNPIYYFTQIDGSGTPVPSAIDGGASTGRWTTAPQVFDAGNTGGGQAHNVLDPYITVYFIIYTGVGLPTATPTPTATSTPTGTITPTPTATATPVPGGQTGPITGTITGSIVITQGLPANAFTTTLTTGNDFVWFRSASYGEIISGAGGMAGFLALVYVAIVHFATRRATP